MPPRRKPYNRERCSRVICERLARSDKPISEIVKGKKYLPSESRFMVWLIETPSLQERYAHAKERQADYIAFDTLRISREESNPNKARNMIQANQWVASKLSPKKYGDKLELNGTLETSGRDPSSLETALAIAALLDQIGQRAAIDVTPPPDDDNPPRLLHVVVPVTKA